MGVTCEQQSVRSMAYCRQVDGPSRNRGLSTHPGSAIPFNRDEKAMTRGAVIARQFRDPGHLAVPVCIPSSCAHWHG